jgi:hypothetical protein
MFKLISISETPVYDAPKDIFKNGCAVVVEVVVLVVVGVGIQLPLSTIIILPLITFIVPVIAQKVTSSPPSLIVTETISKVLQSW